MRSTSKPEEKRLAGPPPSQAMLLGCVPIKHLALVLMLVQNSGFVLVMRYSRRQQAGAAGAAQYNASVVVVLQELFKLVFCFVATSLQDGTGAALATLQQTQEASRVLVPAACFTLQNNILYVALSNLEPLLFQISYQIKTLLTALLSVQMFKRAFTRWQWLSQLMLTAGVVLAQLNEPPKAATSGGGGGGGGDGEGAEQNLLLGLAAVLTAAASSSYASVYFERLLKDRSIAASVASSAAPPATLWQRNTHLCMWTVPMNVALALVSEGAAGGAGALVSAPLRGFDRSTWLIIVVNGLGGLLVAVVMKYADNILKGFATAGAIILTGILAPALGLSPSPSIMLLLGAVLVIGSLFLYAGAPAQKVNKVSPQRTV